MPWWDISALFQDNAIQFCWKIASFFFSPFDCADGVATKNKYAYDRVCATYVIAKSNIKFQFATQTQTKAIQVAGKQKTQFQLCLSNSIYGTPPPPSPHHFPPRKQLLISHQLKSNKERKSPNSIERNWKRVRANWKTCRFQSMGMGRDRFDQIPNGFPCFPPFFGRVKMPKMVKHEVRIA